MSACHIVNISHHNCAGAIKKSPAKSGLFFMLFFNFLCSMFPPNSISLNSNINSLVKTKTLERTTSAAGNINLSMGDFVLVGVLVQNYNYMAVPFRSVDTGYTFAKILNDSLEIVASTSVTVQVWYI